MNGRGYIRLQRLVQLLCGQLGLGSIRKLIVRRGTGQVVLQKLAIDEVDGALEGLGDRLI